MEDKASRLSGARVPSVGTWLKGVSSPLSHHVFFFSFHNILWSYSIPFSISLQITSCWDQIWGPKSKGAYQGSSRILHMSQGSRIHPSQLNTSIQLLSRSFPVSIPLMDWGTGQPVLRSHTYRLALPLLV